MRAAGLSSSKIIYLRGLAELAADGRLQLEQVGRFNDASIMAQLMAVKGIGRWTAQMFLIFSLGRLDVFPEGDLGIRVALQRLHRLPELPGPALCRELASPWRPYATIGSWYCWRSLDLAKGKPAVNFWG
jgi:DNA-3-methyladenine glycosylase II